MNRLIWGFAGCTYHIVRNLMHWLIWKLGCSIYSSGLELAWKVHEYEGLSWKVLNSLKKNQQMTKNEKNTQKNSMQRGKTGCGAMWIDSLGAFFLAGSRNRLNILGLGAAFWLGQTNWLILFYFLFLNQNICCGYSKEPSHWDGSFEHPKHMLKLVGKKIFTILRSKLLLI